MSPSAIKAVLGPTNTGKTHLAIERMCAHSSGAIGFPLRLLAREVYDRVVAIKGEKAVALITGEERIEPPDARYFLCTAEAMPHDGGGHAFVAVDEVQLAADRERGHVFTDRLLNARGREETMLLGSSTAAPVIKSLIPHVELVERPRFSVLTHAGSKKLSRLPKRSAVVAFSSEQVYAIAEMLRRHRGGAAVVMGALSPETRNKQVALFQNGEVDYIVATDAIGMGLNLDVTHVAFASLAKFDGVKRRRLTPAEMAQIAGRAGRHHRDGSFGVLLGAGGQDAEFTEEEIYAIEEHRFQPLTKLYWREAEPRFDSLGTLIADLSAKPGERELAPAPEAIDLAVLRKLAEQPFAQAIRGPGNVRRFWEACSLPDFRQSGVDTHARFVTRLWQDLREGYIGADYVAARIAELDTVRGDIAVLQGRIAAIRSWAYICQRPDWVLARDEMAARARAVEARLSDALHARLTERFVNRRTSVLMKHLGNDPALLPISLEDDGTLLVEDQAIGKLEGFRFAIDPHAAVGDRKMLLSAGEKALPRILATQAEKLRENNLEGLSLEGGRVMWGTQEIARLEHPVDPAEPRLKPARELDRLPDGAREAFLSAIQAKVTEWLAPLEPLRKLQLASKSEDATSWARALLLNLLDGHGIVTREGAGIENLPKEARPFLRKVGVVFGALDIFAPALLKPAPRLAMQQAGIDTRPIDDAMRSVIPAAKPFPAGYRPAGEQLVRVDIAEKLFKQAHEARAKAGGGKKGRGAHFVLDTALAVSTGLTLDSIKRLLGAAGFRMVEGKQVPEGAFGPSLPDRWRWLPSRKQSGERRHDTRGQHRKGRGKPSDKQRGTKGQVKDRKSHAPAKPREPRPENAFAALKDMLS
ncbi:helicase-related protein [Alteriqipengyuania sp.]|uniref:helicase-related protein n=1 Tax=Alteriqipengyuania sp. TaxID=2800692 RepID=UPI0035122059